jgi:hypothetical protein
MGGQARLLFALVACLVVGGAYNYHRNAYLDEDLEFRAYKGLKGADLKVLTQAYEAELQGLQARYAAFGDPDSAGGAKSTGQGVRVNLADFERAQRVNERRKKLHRQILEREVELEALRTEKKIRAEGLDRLWRRILRRSIRL